LEQASPTAQSVLRIMALLAPAPIPRRLLRTILELSAETSLDDPFDEALSELSTQLSLVELDQDKDPSLHRLIAGFVRSQFPSSEGMGVGLPSSEGLGVGKIINAVIAEMDRVSVDEDTAAYQELEKVVPHAEALAESETIEPEQAIDLWNYLWWHHKNWGRFRLAETCGRRALARAEQDLAPGDETIATLQSNLAAVLQDLGELAEARDLLRQALAADQAHFAPGHPIIATAQSNLALVLQDLGELAEEREFAAQAYQSLLRLFGPDHPHTRIVKENLEGMG
jgi:tetratricopeptide (TPR) repeat protein